MLIASVIIGVLAGAFVGSYFWEPMTAEYELGCTASGLMGMIVSIVVFSLLGLI
jgi:hypothetical protein|tara:strand:- start:1843 stop:2004 length:162 start_codon:yes stop_codon:yes gene_type:complete